MIYKLRRKSHSQIEITKMYDRFHLIMNDFEFKKTFPEGEKTYYRVIHINFSWLRWDYVILLRKKR